MYITIYVTSSSGCLIAMQNWASNLHHPSFTISQSLLKLMFIESVMPSNPLILCHPFLLLPSIFSSINLFQWVSFLYGSQSIGGSVSELPMNIHVWFPLEFTNLISCCPRDSQESSPEQFQSINSSVLSLLYGPTLTSIYDYWKNHSCFLICYLGLS